LRHGPRHFESRAKKDARQDNFSIQSVAWDEVDALVLVESLSCELEPLSVFESLSESVPLESVEPVSVPELSPESVVPVVSEVSVSVVSVQVVSVPVVSVPVVVLPLVSVVFVPVAVQVVLAVVEAVSDPVPVETLLVAEVELVPDELHVPVLVSVS
jgi:hypothetical protein